MTKWFQSPSLESQISMVGKVNYTRSGQLQPSLTKDIMIVCKIKFGLHPSILDFLCLTFCVHSSWKFLGTVARVFDGAVAVGDGSGRELQGHTAADGPTARAGSKK